VASQVLQLAAVQAVHPAAAKYLPATQTSQVFGTAQEEHLAAAPKQSPQVPVTGSKVLEFPHTEQKPASTPLVT
jgi:apolipoprotein N-acyltransferase